MLLKKQNSTIELAESQAGIKKEPTKEALNSNGGTDAYRFELFERYYNHLRTNDSKKICYLINKLMNVS